MHLLSIRAPHTIQWPRSGHRAPLFAATLLLSLQAALLIAGPGETAPVRLNVPEIGVMQWVERTTGELIAPRRAVLKMKVNGLLEKVPVKEGDRVTEGQVLGALDMTDATLALDQSTSMAKAIESQIAASKAMLDSAKVGRRQAEIRLDTATRDYQRAKSLRAKDTIPQQQFDQIEGQFLLATSGIEAAEKQIAQAQAALEAAKSQLGVSSVGIRAAKQRLTDSTLVAPFSGLIAAKTMMAHEQSQDQTITLIDDSELELYARLPERLLPAVSLGTALSLRSPMFSEPIKAHITTIIPAVDPKTLSFLVKAVILNGEHHLNHGGYADVEVIVHEESQIPVVPVETVRFEKEAAAMSPNAPRPGFVFTVRDGKAHKTPVTIGLTRNNKASILSGLASGTEIIVLGMEQVDEGTPVEVQR